MNNITQLNEKFKQIKERGYVKTVMNGSGGVGRTFEQLLGKEVENLEQPDYNGIEIKARRGYTNFPITLFNATPDSNENEIKNLVNKYGYPDYQFRMCNVLSASFNSCEKTRVGAKYQFKLHVDNENKRIYLYVYDRYNNLIDNTIYWSFELLEKKLKNKLSLLAIVVANRKFVNEVEYFHYVKIYFYQLKNFKFFIDLIKRGKIIINMKISVYRRGDRIGNIKDHGTSFRIDYNDVDELFIKIIV